MATTREAPPTLQALTRRELIFPQLAGLDRASVLRELATRLTEAGVVGDAERLYGLLDEREALGSTGIGAGVAVPHCKVKGIDQVVCAVGLAEHEIDFDSADGKPVRLFFVVLSPHDQPAAHLRSLAAISRWVQEKDHLARILAGRDRDEIFDTLRVKEDGD